MGVFTEYLDQKFSSAELAEERKKQLNRISTLRGKRALLTYAADFTKGSAKVPIDLAPARRQIETQTGRPIVT